MSRDQGAYVADMLEACELRTARRRLEQMGVITPDGELASSEAPADMTPGSETSVDTG